MKINLYVVALFGSSTALACGKRYFAPESAALPISSTAPQHVPAVPSDEEADPERKPPKIVSGRCSFLAPKAMRQVFSPEQRTQFVSRIQTWLGSDHSDPRVEYHQGVLYVEGEEDRGDDPPYPRSSGTEGFRVCGHAAVWLRTSLKRTLQSELGGGEPLTCDDNVCCFGGAVEYDPTVEVAFEMDAKGRLYLRGWLQAQVAGLSREVATSTLLGFTKVMKHALETSPCPGEPAGAY